jgi:hypothetical protein
MSLAAASTSYPLLNIFWPVGPVREFRDFGQQHTGPSPADQLAITGHLGRPAE